MRYGVAPTSERATSFNSTDSDLFNVVIQDLDSLDPFLISVASASDVWIFLGSHGGITAGRRNAEHAVFPYSTEDKLADTANATGGVTVIRTREGTCWEPLKSTEADLRRSRWLAKTVLGDEVTFGETHRGLGLDFRVSYRCSPAFGVVRRCEIVNTSSAAVEFEILDGFQNLLPAGITERTQNELSVLLDAYKRSEIDPGSGLGLFSLSSLLTDLAEPAEALSATVAWQLGALQPTHLASTRQLDAFRRGATLTDESGARGVRGAYFSDWNTRLQPGESATWSVVADTGLDSASARDLRERLLEPQSLAKALEKDLDEARQGLISLLAEADAHQTTGDHSASAHHMASVLYNAMRGGIPRNGHELGREGFRRHLQQHNAGLAERVSEAVDALPEAFTVGELVQWAQMLGEPDAVRLAMTYLPFSFSRRHGDPSRPWNRFDIVLTDAQGNPASGFQGNWRDIFQNWEALAWSYPDFTENMVSVFLNAITVDGYNPYRITHQGIDWEVPEPENPWSNIGYWGDHQIVYLLRLLELSRDQHPGRLASSLNNAVFATADLPYRISDFDEILKDPSATIGFDDVLDQQVRERAGSMGGDGMLKHEPSGDLFRTTLADKLLLLATAKMVNFIPDCGIWMNTQRPEWNDANNALVGHGASVVTMAHMARFIDYLKELLGDRDVLLRPELATLVRELTAVLRQHAAASTELDAVLRHAMVSQLGHAGETYRQVGYTSHEATLTTLTAAEVSAFLEESGAWLKRGVRANKRGDGLFHSYNTLVFGDERIDVEALSLMLEGQVAVLWAGGLDPAEVLAVTTALRSSDLYRADQHSYLLYPNRDLPGFLEKNNISSAKLAACRGAESVLSLPGQSVLVRDSVGGVHFADGVKNASVLRSRLDALERSGLDVDRDMLLKVYEDTFTHRNFTGRPGSFFAYEGLGSIYWHMVSKLALSVLDVRNLAITEGSDPAVVDALGATFRDIRSGLGFAKTAHEFGAFPSDPYSHTPAHTGARQPGMTGQAKEDVIMRFSELGVSMAAGVLSFHPEQVADQEWLLKPTNFTVPSTGASILLESDQLAFMLCGIPIVYERGGTTVLLETRDGETVVLVEGMDASLSARIFARDGFVAQLSVQ